ncbi:hypothetical protein CMK11_13530 [Candidatus Poribacteria bacterium]|nr:hypothetical protein [Candidatus Poribacteria bacterium]
MLTGPASPDGRPPIALAALWAAIPWLWVAATAASAPGGTVEIHDVESRAIASNQMGITSLRRVLVYVPPGYVGSRRSYPTLYWIPGWETPASREYVGALDEAIGKRRIPPVIVVHIDVREGVVLLNSSVFGAWEDFLTQELVPFIDTEYRTIPTPRGRAIMGHSSGGYGAIMAATLHPGIWGAVGLNDPAAWAACERDVAAYPAEFGDYPYLRNNAKALVQIGIAIAPNPEVPRRFDVPVPLGSDGEATARAWERYCLLREAGVRAHLDGLNLLSAIEVVAPRRSVWTNRDASRKMVAVMRGHGLPVFLMETPGSHGGARPARFIELARRLRRVIDPGFPDATRTAALTWGGVKGDAAR